MRFYVPSSEDSVFASGSYELPIQEEIASLLRPGSIFYDVGANYGFFTLLAARIIGSVGAVISFEPTADNVRTIQANAHANRLKNITVVPCAVSDKSGVETLNLAEYGGGSALMSAGTPRDKIGETQVEVVSLDDFASTRGSQPPDVVKIDVEGAEYRVLQGMRGLLATKRPALIIEFDDAELLMCEKKLNDAQFFLQSMGYQTTPLANCYNDGGWFVRHLRCIAN
jgi:FkbM family methyltransferase